ncbi:MAG: slipin family protein, partial [Planctomycetales bacterium]
MLKLLVFKRYKIRTYEIGLLFRDGEFQRLLHAGTYWFVDPLLKIRVDILSQREPWIAHEKLDLIIKSGALAGNAIVLDLKDHERALVWLENRFSHILPPGQYAYWTGQKSVRVEVVDIRGVRFAHEEFKVIVRSPQAGRLLEVVSIQREHVGVLFID